MIVAGIGTISLSVAIIVVSVLLIGLILLQKNRGSGLSGAFGGVGGHSAFGTKTGDIMTWITVGLVAVFLLLNVAGNYVFEPDQPPLGPTGGGASPPAGQQPATPPTGQTPVPVTPLPVSPSPGSGAANPPTNLPATPAPVAPGPSPAGATPPSPAPATPVPANSPASSGSPTTPADKPATPGQ